MKILIILVSSVISGYAVAHVGEFKVGSEMNSDKERMLKEVVSSFNENDQIYNVKKYEINEGRELKLGEVNLPKDFLWTKEKASEVLEACGDIQIINVDNQDVMTCHQYVVYDPEGDDGDLEIEEIWVGSVPIDGIVRSEREGRVYQVTSFEWAND